MVEFALVGPLLFLCVIVILEAAFLANAQVTLDNASREGARAASVCGSSIGGTYYGGAYYTSCRAAVEGQVNKSLGFLAHGAPLTVLLCSPSPLNGDCPAGTPYRGQAGSDVQVDVHYQYDYYVAALIGRPPSMKATLTSRARVEAQR